MSKTPSQIAIDQCLKNSNNSSECCTNSNDITYCRDTLLKNLFASTFK